MQETKQISILECLLFAAGDQGLSIKQISSALEITEQQAWTIIETLMKHYDEDPARGITVIPLAGTYQLATKKELADYLQKLVESPSVSILSQASLETLAIISYKQPITRLGIEEIRGVKSERPIQTLIAKGLIKEVGRAEGTGRPKLYGTTREFLDYFGLNSLQELPSLPQNSEEEPIEDLDLFMTQFQETIE